MAIINLKCDLPFPLNSHSCLFCPIPPYSHSQYPTPRMRGQNSLKCSRLLTFILEATVVSSKKLLPFLL